MSKLNLAGIIVGLGVGIVTLWKGLLPLATVPDRVEKIDLSVQAVRRDVDEVGKVQSVQAETLKRLLELTDVSSQMRRDVDVNRAEIAELKRRLDRVEAR